MIVSDVGVYIHIYILAILVVLLSHGSTALTCLKKEAAERSDWQFNENFFPVCPRSLDWLPSRGPEFYLRSCCVATKSHLLML